MSSEEDIKKITSKAQSNYRWIVLPFTCIATMANIFTYDIPSALMSQTEDHMGSDNFEINYSLLYSVYAFPNVILPLFGGLFIDKYGASPCYCCFVCLMALGQLILSVGIMQRSWPIMWVGRIVYGLGAENFGVANSSIVADWFIGKELALAFGIGISISRMGGVTNNLVSPRLAEKYGIEFAYWFGVILLGVSTFCAFCIFPIDKKVREQIAMNKRGSPPVLALTKKSTSNPMTASETDEDKTSKKSLSEKQDTTPRISTVSEAITLSEVWKMKTGFWCLAWSILFIYGLLFPYNNIISTFLLERDFFKTPPDSCMLQDPFSCQSNTNLPVSCPSSEWYQPPLPVNFTTGDISCEETFWSDDCTVEYCSRLEDARIYTATIMSIPFIVSAVLAPFYGKFTDEYGLRATVIAITSLVFAIVQILLGLTTITPVFPLVLQGLAFTGYAAVTWPALAMVVEPRLVGLSYGLANCFQNTGFAIFPLIAAKIYEDSNNKYIPNVNYLFMTLGFLGFFVGVYLKYYDYYYNGNLLDLPTQEAKKRNSSITTRQTSTRHTQNFEDEDELDTEHTTWINRLSHAK